jgi:hypothetical protein
LAGIAVPTLALIIIMTAYAFFRYVCNIPIPVERLIVFPMAAVPNIWGLWNVLYVAAIARRNVPLGLYGGFLPLLLGPLGYGVAHLLDFAIPHVAFRVLPFALPAALILYYLVWKHIVGFLNRELGIA